MYLYHFFWFILPGLPDFFHQKHFNMCTVKSCRFIEKESAASRCTFASTRHPHGTCHIRGRGCPGPPFQCCTLGVKTPQQEFSMGPFCFTVAIDLILNLHLLLLLGWGSHKEIILIYLITFLFVLCVQRGGMWEIFGEAEHATLIGMSVIWSARSWAFISKVMSGKV